jgi:hypothetical protein
VFRLTEVFVTTVTSIRCVVLAVRYIIIIIYEEKAACYYKHVLYQRWKIVGSDTILSTIRLLLVPATADSVHIYLLQPLNATIRF